MTFMQVVWAWFAWHVVAPIGFLVALFAFAIVVAYVVLFVGRARRWIRGRLRG